MLKIIFKYLQDILSVIFIDALEILLGNTVLLTICVGDLGEVPGRQSLITLLSREGELVLLKEKTD